jgi:hypothetical protein
VTPVGPNRTLSACRLDEGMFSWACAKLAMPLKTANAAMLSFTESFIGMTPFIFD